MNENFKIQMLCSLLQCGYVDIEYVENMSDSLEVRCEDLIDYINKEVVSQID
jgi:hypothetical protein